MKEVKEMTVREAIEAEVEAYDVASHMDALAMNSVDVKNKEEVVAEIRAIMYDAVGDPFNNVNVAYDLKSLVDLVNAVEK